MAIFAGTRGYLDRIEVGDVTRFEAAMLEELRAKRPDLLESIRKTGELSGEVEKELEGFATEFAKTFA